MIQSKGSLPSGCGVGSDGSNSEDRPISRGCFGTSMVCPGRLGEVAALNRGLLNGLGGGRGRLGLLTIALTENSGLGLYRLDTCPGGDPLQADRG